MIELIARKHACQEIGMKIFRRKEYDTRLKCMSIQIKITRHGNTQAKH